MTRALDLIEAAPEDAVFVGDSVWDVYAARKAGLDCVGVTCGGTSAGELAEAGAIAVYRDPAALVADREGFAQLLA